MNSSQPINHVLDPLDALRPKRIISILLDQIITNGIKTLSLAKKCTRNDVGPQGGWIVIIVISHIV